MCTALLHSNWLYHQVGDAKEPNAESVDVQEPGQFCFRTPASAIPVSISLRTLGITFQEVIQVNVEDKERRKDGKEVTKCSTLQGCMINRRKIVSSKIGINRMSKLFLICWKAALSEVRSRRIKAYYSRNGNSFQTTMFKFRWQSARYYGAVGHE